MKHSTASLMACLAIAGAANAQSDRPRRVDDWGIISFETADGEARTLRLAGIDLPRPGSPGHELAMRALDAHLAETEPVVLVTGNAGEDRYGHLVADFDLGGLTLAEAMVRNGYAIVYTWPETRDTAIRLLPLERAAREAELGLWGAGILAVRSPDPNNLALYLETVQIVEGRVISVGETNDRTYLNFGFDYRSDFTVSIAQQDVQRFADAGIELASLEGRIIRVRGWLQAINGPSISINHAERIEILTPLPGPN
jgi:endonuclease YncB( thermonuclease family)